jgi:hypothetical protein
MFTGPSNKIFNQLTFGTAQAWQQGRYLKSAGITVGIGLSMLAFWCIGAGRAPEDDEDWWQAMGAGTMDLVPVIGPTVAAVIRGYNQPSAPAQQVVQSAADAITEANKARERTGTKQLKSVQNSILSGFEALGLSAGVPLTTPIRIFRAATTQNPGEIIGWRPKKD